MFTLLKRQKEIIYHADSIVGIIETFYKRPDKLRSIAKKGGAR